MPASEWNTVNQPLSPIIKVVLFEGWSVGFRALSPSTLEQKHRTAVDARSHDLSYKGRLGHNTLQSITDINAALHGYDEITDQLDAFIHIDAADPQYVYKWRLQQEAGLRAKKGMGMTDEQIRHFVDGYYPAYELFTETLRTGVFGTQAEDQGRQLRLVVGEDRKVVHAERI